MDVWFCLWLFVPAWFGCFINCLFVVDFFWVFWVCSLAMLCLRFDLWFIVCAGLGLFLVVLLACLLCFAVLIAY